jgi:hypothetical protein
VRIYLFEALRAVRRDLEPHDIELMCNGARRAVFPSPMLRQASQGRRAYVLPLQSGGGRPPTVDIFDAARGHPMLGTVADQDEWFRLRQRPGTGGAT